MGEKISKRDNYVSNFHLVGRPVITDYTFKIDAENEASTWRYNNLNLGIDCGEKHGTVYANLMGGYSLVSDSVIYAHGKKDNGSDDFENRIIVEWENRLDEETLDEIGDNCFIKIGIEKTDEGKTYVEKFLSAYDAIAYIKEHLTGDMVVNVRGNLRYSVYKDNVQVQKEITSIYISNAEPDGFVAEFKQSILLDKDSINIKSIDKERETITIDAMTLEYFKEYDGVEYKGYAPQNYTFELALPSLDKDKVSKLLSFYKVKKGITQINMEGNFIESGATVKPTWDDVPDDIKELVTFGIYTEEEALEKCAVNGNRERRMILTKPIIKLVGENNIPQVQKFDEKYTDDDMDISVVEKVEPKSAPADEDEDLKWLEELV